MGTNQPSKCLTWAQEIQALGQIGLHYAENDYQRERFHRLMEIAAEMLASGTNWDYENLIRIYDQQTGYATPRVDVRSAVFRDNKLLMVRERMDGGWTMPGGWADVGDTPSFAAEREVMEEAGFNVKAQRVIGVYDANRVEPLSLFHAYKIVFLCDLIDGEAQPSMETSQVEFFGYNDLPFPLSPERTKYRHIQDAFAAAKDENWQTVFD